MPAKKERESVRSVYVDIEKELGNGYIMKDYLGRVAAVRVKATGEVVALPLGAKNLYFKLASYGHSCGYNSIYENQEKLAYDLGVSEKSITNYVKVLRKIGLIIVQPHKDKSQYGSNSYWLRRPNMLDGLQWLDVNKDLLKGKLYNFNYKQFSKSIEDCNNDKLLGAILKHVKQNQALLKGEPSVTFEMATNTKEPLPN